MLLKPQDLVTLLRHDRAKADFWLRVLPLEQRLDLSGADLSGLDLRDLSHRRLDLTGSCLVDCRAEVSHLARCRLQDTDLSGVIIDEDPAPLEQIAALWSGTQDWQHWRETHEPHLLYSADFSKADFRGMDLSDLVMPSGHFDSADFRGAKLTGTDFADASFCNARLQDSTYDRVKWMRANLSGVNLSKSTLSLCDLDGAVLSDALCRETRFDRCNAHYLTAKGTSFERATFFKTVMIEAILSGSSFHGARLERVSVDGSDMSSVNLRDAVLDPTYPLRQVNLDGADLRGAVGMGLDESLNLETALQ